MIIKDDNTKKNNDNEMTIREALEQGWLCSVTGRIKIIKQPYGGYVKPSEFEIIDLHGGRIEDLNENENVHPILIGLAVDYLTRYYTGTKLSEVLMISFEGAKRIDKLNEWKLCFSKIKGLDDVSIENVIKIVGFDTVYRAGCKTYKPIEEINPNKETIRNVRVMVQRALSFFYNYGPKILDGLTFNGGYTKYIISGDGDFLTSDTLWDFKVSKRERLNSQQTLQLLIYWRMGLHSMYKQYYEKIKHLGVYNPRRNCIFRISTDKISKETIADVEEKVIGY